MKCFVFEYINMSNTKKNGFTYYSQICSNVNISRDLTVIYWQKIIKKYDFKAGIQRSSFVSFMEFLKRKRLNNTSLSKFFLSLNYSNFKSIQTNKTYKNSTFLYSYFTKRIDFWTVTITLFNFYSTSIKVL
jgi:hypothetical protein